MRKIMKIEAICCECCGGLFDIESDEFYTVQGNIYKGTKTGIIGNNFTPEMVVKQNVHYCTSCFANILCLNRTLSTDF